MLNRNGMRGISTAATPTLQNRAKIEARPIATDLNVLGRIVEVNRRSDQPQPHGTMRQGQRPRTIRHSPK
jgi:hypothetical protein